MWLPVVKSMSEGTGGALLSDIDVRCFVIMLRMRRVYFNLVFAASWEKEKGGGEKKEESQKGGRIG